MRLASSGAVAQLVEHLLCKEDVRSSSLLGSTASDRTARVAPALYGAVTIAVNSAVPAPDFDRPTGHRADRSETPSFGPTHDHFVRAPERVVLLNK